MHGIAMIGCSLVCARACAMRMHAASLTVLHSWGFRGFPSYWLHSYVRTSAHPYIRTSVYSYTRGSVHPYTISMDPYVRTSILHPHICTTVHPYNLTSVHGAARIFLQSIHYSYEIFWVVLIPQRRVKCQWNGNYVSIQNLYNFKCFDH